MRPRVVAVVLIGPLLAVLWQAEPAGRQAPGEELSESYRGSQRDNVEYQKVAPFRVFDDLYYVGPGFVSVWLIRTSDGLVLVDAAQEPYVDHVIAGIGKMGFDPRDIRYILVSHGHLDHFGGVARMQALSGARVGMLEEDWVASKQDRDLVLRDGQTLTVGTTALKLYKHPGHTPGSLSIAFTVHDGGAPHTAFLFGGPGPRGGVEGAEQFVVSANAVAAIPGIEVAVPVHSWLNDFHYPGGGVFERARRLAARRPGEPHPFVDPGAWREWIEIVQQGAARNLDEQRRKAADGGP